MGVHGGASGWGRTIRTNILGSKTCMILHEIAGFSNSGSTHGGPATNGLKGDSGVLSYRVPSKVQNTYDYMRGDMVGARWGKIHGACMHFSQ